MEKKINPMKHTAPYLEATIRYFEEFSNKMGFSFTEQPSFDSLTESQLEAIKEFVDDHDFGWVEQKERTLRKAYELFFEALNFLKNPENQNLFMSFCWFIGYTEDIDGSLADKIQEKVEEFWLIFIPRLLYSSVYLGAFA